MSSKNGKIVFNLEKSTHHQVRINGNIGNKLMSKEDKYKKKPCNFRCVLSSFKWLINYHFGIITRVSITRKVNVICTRNKNMHELLAWHNANKDYLSEFQLQNETSWLSYRPIKGMQKLIHKYNLSKNIIFL